MCEFIAVAIPEKGKMDFYPLCAESIEECYNELNDFGPSLWLFIDKLVIARHVIDDTFIGVLEIGYNEDDYHVMHDNFVFEYKQTVNISVLSSPY